MGIDDIRVISPSDLHYVQNADHIIIDEIYHVLKQTILTLHDNGKLNGVFDSPKSKTWTFLGGNR